MLINQREFIFADITRCLRTNKSPAQRHRTCWYCDLTDALCYIHSLGIAHADIRILSQYPILEALRSSLNEIDLARLRAVNTRFRQNFMSHFMKPASVDRLYTRFFDDTKGFRHALRQCRGVVSRSSALQFFSGHQWHSDLDIYVEMKRTEALVRFFVSTTISRYVLFPITMNIAC